MIAIDFLPLRTFYVTICFYLIWNSYWASSFLPFLSHFIASLFLALQIIPAFLRVSLLYHHHYHRYPDENSLAQFSEMQFLGICQEKWSSVAEWLSNPLVSLTEWHLQFCLDKRNDLLKFLFTAYLGCVYKETSDFCNQK